MIIGVAIVVWSFYTFLQKPVPERYQTNNQLLTTNSKILIGDKSIEVEIARTNEERVRGLSGRESVEPNTGLLFVFDTPGRYGFWMKDMKFAIDIVWVDEGWEVVGIESMINPDSYPMTFYPPEDIRYVLELNSNEASSLGIDIGTRLYLEEKN